MDNFWGSRLTFTFDQAHAFFSYRLGDPTLPMRDSIMCRCPFHGDRTASMSVNLGKGGLWNCHACNVGGGIYDFETQMFPGRTTDEAWEQIYRITGATPTHTASQRKLGKLEASYPYLDEDGNTLYEKQRYEGKVFLQRARKGSGWVYSLQGVRKLLYRLPELMLAKVIFIVEGEKDANNLFAALAGKITVNGIDYPASTTCNFDGAGKWLDEYSPYLAGRRVIVVEDNDAAGKAHAEMVAKSVVKFALWVKILRLPGLKEKGDVSDFLQDHTIEDLLREVGKTPHFRADAKLAEAQKPFLVVPSEILPAGGGDVSWIIPGVIHKGAKGLIVAQPKAGKSMIALDLAIAISSGQSWLGLQPERSVNTAVVSREDGPQMTQHRLREFARGRGLAFNNLKNLYVNTFEQKATFSIENDDDLGEICTSLKKEGVELVIFDVLNKLHGAEENDNTKMTAIMSRFDIIRAETGSDVCVIHHDAKNSAPGAKKPRGASSIDSWWDWKISISVSADDDSRKEVYFASKAGQPHAPIQAIFQNNPLSGTRISLAG